MDRISKIKNIDYLLLFMLIGMSVIPIFKSASIGIYATIACLVFLIKRFYITKGETVILVIVLLLEIYHNVRFSGYDVISTRQVFCYFLFALLTVNYLKLNLLTIYIKILYFLTLISFVFFILYYIDKSSVIAFSDLVPDIFKTSIFAYGETTKQINPIFYNFDYNLFERGRNNGAFWEPTVFAIMLIIAQIFNLFITKKLFNKKGIVFTIGILTTFSTTCFLAYFILLLGYFLSIKTISNFKKGLLCVIVVFIGLNLYSNLSFLSTKIQDEFSNIDSEIDKRGGNSRMASAFLDISEISQKAEYVLFGKGSTKSVRIGAEDKNVLRNCGDTALLVEWGIFFFILYFILIYYSFYRLAIYYKSPKYFPIMITVIFLICGFSEAIFDHAFFHIFIFFGLTSNNVYRSVTTSSSHDHTIEESLITDNILSIKGV